MSTAASDERYGFEHVTLGHIRRDMKFRQPAPERLPDFDLSTTDGGRLRASDIMGRQPLLLVTGSASCPMTASSMPMLKRLHSEFGDRVAFVMLYVREAHPGENFPQPQSLEEKLRHARALQVRAAMPWPVVVDDVDGSLHRALDAKPNSAHLTDREGRIVFRALWAGDEGPLRAALEKVANGELPRECESQHRLMPMAEGLGRMRDVLHSVGPFAEHDIWRAAPPIALTAWTASLFRPLPPRLRTLAAVMLFGLVAGALVTAARRARA